MGPWTELKLNAVTRYLKAYRTALRAQRFTLTYIDAFAGTGYWDEDQQHTDSALALLPPHGVTPRKGSARLALEIDPPFDDYLFVEKDEARFGELLELKREFGNAARECKHGDANTELRKYCEGAQWSSRRAVAFLDPYATHVEWETIQALGATRSIDLLLLVPVMGLTRMLPRTREPPLEWQSTLDRVFGTSAWRDLYARDQEIGLFEINEVVWRRGNIESIRRFVIDRLKAAFVPEGVAKQALALINSRRQTLFLLMFACGNRKGARVALPIWNGVLKAIEKDHPRHGDIRH